jgi:hypothetical protein
MYNIYDDLKNQLAAKVDNVNVSQPLTNTGGTSPEISLPQGNGERNGYISASDWSTFNAKSKLLHNTSALPQILVANTTTYLTNSNLSTAHIKAGTIATWYISITKTNAGTQAPVFTIRFGTAASTADSTLVTFTGSAQTAAVDTGMVMIRAIFRATGNGTAIISAHYNLTHNLASTGLANVPANNNAQLSGTFNSTTANSFLGLTVNSGASAIWTINQIDATIENLI